MSGGTDLKELLASMTPKLEEGVFVFSCVHPDTDLSAMDYLMSFREAEGMTLILRREDALVYGVGTEYPCRQITLNVHSSLEAVGFLAEVTRELAAVGISVNPVSACFHDHLFVPDDRAHDAMEVLRQLSARAAQS